MPKRGLIFAVLILLLAQPAMAVKIADITRLNGARTNVLIGHGLVVGLKGTGDGGAFLPAIRPLAALLSKFEDPTTVAELSNANNIAIVQMIASIPENGVRNGDHIDVIVMSDGAATSLAGGHLLVSPLMGPTGDPYIARAADGTAMRPIPYALAHGTIDIEDITSPLSGVIKGGGEMEVDLEPRVIDPSGRFTLVLDEPSASWSTASTIAKLINEAGDTGENIATVLDAKNIQVTIPTTERERPDSFISAVLRLPVPILPTQARVQINDKTGTMIITGDVEISPVVISQKGLTITTINPQPIPTARTPQVGTKENIALDTTSQGGAKLQDLAAAFDQLKVPAADRITIVKELYKTGKLHAKLYVDGQQQ